MDPIAVRSHEMARTRATLISLLASYAGASITIVKGVVFVPLYLHFLGIDLYGAWLASGNVVGLLGMLDVGIGSVIQQTLAESWGKSNTPRFVRLAGAGLLCTGVISLVVVAAGMGASPFVPRIIGAQQAIRADLSLAFVLATVGAACTLLLGTLLAISAAWQRTQVGAVARISGQLVEVVCVGGGLFAGFGVISLGMGALAGAVTAVAIGAIQTVNHWRALQLPRPVAARAEAIELARTAAPSMLSRIALQIDANVEVAFVSALISPSSAAVYAMTDRILKVAMSFINPIANSAFSSLSHFFGVNGARATEKPVRELLGAWSLVVAAVLPALLAFNQDFTSLWVGATNYGGLALNTAFFASETLGGREMLFSMVLVSTGAFRTAAWITTSEVFARLPLMYLGLRLAGPIGIPLATAAISIPALFFYVQQVNRRLDLDRNAAVNLNRIGLTVISLSFAMALAEARWLPHASGWLMLLVKGVLLGSLHAGVSLLLLSGPRKTVQARVVGLLKLR